jgi:hypothetical protein
MKPAINAYTFGKVYPVLGGQEGSFMIYPNKQLY